MKEQPKVSGIAKLPDAHVPITQLSFGPRGSTMSAKS